MNYANFHSTQITTGFNFITQSYYVCTGRKIYSGLTKQQTHDIEKYLNQPTITYSAVWQIVTIAILWGSIAAYLF